MKRMINGLFSVASILMVMVVVWMTIGQARPTNQPAVDAQKAIDAQKVVEERFLRNANLVLSLFWGQPVDIYMVGTDMKQPTFSSVRLFGTRDGPNDVIFYTGVDSENHDISFNPAQIAAYRAHDARPKPKPATK